MISVNYCRSLWFSFKKKWLGAHGWQCSAAEGGVGLGLLPVLVPKKEIVGSHISIILLIHWIHRFLKNYTYSMSSSPVTKRMSAGWIQRNNNNNNNNNRAKTEWLLVKVSPGYYLGGNPRSAHHWCRYRYLSGNMSWSGSVNHASSKWTIAAFLFFFSNNIIRHMKQMHENWDFFATEPNNSNFFLALNRRNWRTTRFLSRVVWRWPQKSQVRHETSAAFVGSVRWQGMGPER